MIHIALIGYGYWGPNLARNLFALDDAELTLCCDLEPKRLATAQKLYPGIRVTSRVEEVWNDPGIDAVVIATPAQTHCDLAIAAMRAGKHALVEKPLALSSIEVEKLIEGANARNLVLMVGHTFEYNPAVLKIKQLLDQQGLGEIRYAYSTRVNLGRVQRDLSALWSIAPHDISILLFLLDEVPVEVSTRGGAYLSVGVEDVVFVDLLFQSGFRAHIHASWLDPSKVRRMTLVGSKKMVVYDDIDGEAKIKIYDKGVLRVGGGDIFGEYQYRLHSGDIHIPTLDMSEPLRNECEHFVECIKLGKRPRTDGLNALRVIKVLEASQRSLRANGAPVEVL